MAVIISRRSSYCPNFATTPGNVYRDGVLVRRIKPLEPALIAPISSRYLSEDERITIAELHQQGCSCRYIAQQ